MFNFLKICFAVFSVLFCFQAKAESPFFENDQISVQVYQKQYPDKKQILFAFQLKNGWHISWDNPGDAGVPTAFLFSPQSVLRVAQTSPQVFVYDDLLTQYGYTSQAFYLFETGNITQPVTATVSWTVCKDYCEPQKAQITLPPNRSDRAFDAALYRAQSTFPKIFNGNASAKYTAGGILLTFTDTQSLFQEPSKILFIPAEQDSFAPDEPQQASFHNTTLNLFISTEENVFLPLNGILTDGNSSYQVNFSFNTESIFIYLLLAFLGGILLNLMPCVLPVLSLKALELYAAEKKEHHFRNGLGYFAGVLCSFISIAGILFVLKKGGASLGWGFQLQSPVFVGILLVFFIIIFAFLVGIFKIHGKFLTQCSKLSGLNAFCTGFFAVLVASPCTGPFMGAALGYAFLASDITYFAIFTALGVGYALPLTLLEMFPKVLHKLLPHPGKWMNTLKYILAVPVLLTICWLAWLLCCETGSLKQAEIFEPYTPKAVENARLEGRPALIDFTAKWCLTCLLNEKTTLHTKKFTTYASEHHIALFKADWTSKNQEILQALQYYGRTSVPLYVYYPENQEDYIILPQILTPNILFEQLK